MSSVDYLVKDVATGDGWGAGVGSPLTRYYSAEGYPPGTWVGSGLAGLGASDRVGSEVSEAQLMALFEDVRSPFDGSVLGRAPARYPTRQERIQKRMGSLPSAMPEAARAAAVERITAEEQETNTRNRVAGFDLTFSVPKSVSALWAVADHNVQVKLYDAHRAALAATLKLIEDEALFTRIGSQGARRVRTGGMIAAAFDHWDSRKGDPQLHTHVTVANRVQGTDGKWRTIDSASLFRSAVAFSETYNLLLADEVTRSVGLAWAPRERGRRRRVAREIRGVPDALIAAFSQRSADIEAAVDTAVDRYLERKGRRPSARALNRMRQHITLDTRDAKKASSLSDAAALWEATARSVLEEDPAEWATRVTRAADTTELPIRLLRAEDLEAPSLAATAGRVVDEVSGARSTWTRWNLVAETMRQMAGMAWQFATVDDAVAVRDRLVEAAERLSVSIGAAQISTVPDAFRDEHGVSEFARPPVFTSAAVLEAEDALLALAGDTSGPAVERRRAEDVGVKPLAGRPYALSAEDQAPAAVGIVTSGRVVDLLIGPAGTGKTTSMAGVRAMWEAQHGPGSVVGLAPAAKAAEVLAADLGIITDNTAQWLAQQRLQPDRALRIVDLHERRQADAAAGPSTNALDGVAADAQREYDRWSLRPGQLLIVDEAGMAGTFVLTALARQAHKAGAKLLLVGDPCQLSAVETGGAFGLLAASRPDTPTLSVVRRFTDPDGSRRVWEENAAAGLRVGDETAAAEYIRRGRVHAGERDDMVDTAYAAWLADTAGGVGSVLIAADNDTVRTLNQRARADLVAGGAVDDEGTTIRLHDGLSVGRGDRIVTREIDRYLTDGTGASDRRGRRTDGFVRNGQQWLVDRARRDGSLSVRLLDSAGGPGAAAVTLPADYVRAHVELAYATTAHRAQGMTTDTAHVLADAGTAREMFYVAMTRGRHSNQAYLSLDQRTVGADDHRHSLDGADSDPLTRAEVLHAIATNSGAQPSAHEAIRVEQDRAGSIAQLAVEAETIASYAHELAAGDLLLAALGQNSAVLAVLDDDRFDRVVTAIRAARTVGIDPATALPAIAAPMQIQGALTAEGLADALRQWTAAVAEAGPPTHRRMIAGILPDATAGLTDPQMLTALRERYELIETRAGAVLDRDIAAGAEWLRRLPRPGGDPADWRATARLVAAYRDRWGVTDRSPLGRAPDRSASFSQQADHRRINSALSNLSTRSALLPDAGRIARANPGRRL